MATKKRKKKNRREEASLRAKLVMGGLALAFLILMAVIIIGGGKGDVTDPMQTPPVQTGALTVASPLIENTPAPTYTPEPTPTPTPTPTPVPTPVPKDLQTVGAIHPDGDVAQNGLEVPVQLRVDDEIVETYAREEEIHMGDSLAYASVDGITTFRGNNYRDGASFGAIPNNPNKLNIVWKKSVGYMRDSDGNKWTGVGWTGQASVVKWSDEVKHMMNIAADKKAKDGLTEVILATMDGKIYFLDLDDGAPTREVIRVGAPMKGSLTIDPRGYPLLYVGQGIYKLENKTVKCGTRVYSLIDQEEQFFLNGQDSAALRKWYAFDAAPLIDGKTDTMLQLGENGILYLVKLNTAYAPEQGAISVDPEVVRYVYKHNLKDQLGSENSIAVYNNYAYFANNSGLLQCVDLNTLTLKWAFDTGDDTDATCAIEVEDDGLVALYTACELELKGKKGDCYMRKFNALTGEELWCASAYISTSGSSEGGAFASPAVGKGTLKDIVYFHLARTKDEGGTLLALNKATGDIVWKKSLGKYGWSSPVCCYSADGVGYVVVCSSDGAVRLLKGLTGELVASTNLTQNIESSPVVYEDMIVVSTRGGAIYGIRIE